MIYAKVPCKDIIEKENTGKKKKKSYNWDTHPPHNAASFHMASLNGNGQIHCQNSLLKQF